jgi:predicted GIY-YIG superfamily endonuclease
MGDSDIASEETTLYVLKLQHGKYYVGSTGNLSRRIAEHCAGTGSAWTRLHRPIGTNAIVHRQRGNRFHEDAIVYTYMSRYGRDNVRGGTHSSVVLSEASRDDINRQLRHAGNQCFNCGSNEHFANQCPHFSGSPADHERRRDHGRRRRMECTRCGRDSHTEEDCFAATHVNGNFLAQDDDESDDSSESSDSAAGDNRAGRFQGSQQLRSLFVRHPQEQRTRGFSRCGRDSHSVDRCYASRHADGSFLAQDDDDDDDDDDEGDESSESSY